MSSLTTRQRDLLGLLLDADTALVTADIARQLHLTPRQVNYSLKGMRPWLQQHDVKLDVKPGVGVRLAISSEQQQTLYRTLNKEGSYQLVLNASQRQQLLAYYLLLSDEPHILYELQQMAQVSRTTILKDLDSVTEWVAQFDLELERRPNYGIEFSGTEMQRRQALCALLWGSYGDDSLWQMTHTEGLTFSLAVDAHLLPLLENAREMMRDTKVRPAIKQVAHAEADLGGRFSDVAVLHLALVIAVQAQRIRSNHYLQTPPVAMQALRAHPIWETSKLVMEIRPAGKLNEDEITFLAAHLLTSVRNTRWPADFEDEGESMALIGRLMHTISTAYQLPDLVHDTTLRDGLLTHVIPACLRQQFGLWSPPQTSNRLSDKYEFEHNLAETLAEMIERERETTLPQHEINNLALLIRAAYIRERPNRLQRVIVICHSGMATAQLLTARLRARFPRLNNIDVLSLRELNEVRLYSADLIITTIPLGSAITNNHQVIQVHPLLLPEDVEAITRWLD